MLQHGDGRAIGVPVRKALLKLSGVILAQQINPLTQKTPIGEAEHCLSNYRGSLQIGATSIKTDSGNWTRAQAEVINDGETSFSSVFLVAVYKDASGNIIGSGAGGEGIDAGTSKIIETSATFPRDDLSVASTEFYVSWQL